MKWYLAGPMTGIPQHNIPLFDEAASKLRSQGFDILSPAELDAELRPEFREQALADDTGLIVPDGLSHAEVVARDVKLIGNEAGGIIFLPGWSVSRGARLEAYIGLLYELKFLYYIDGRVQDCQRHVVKSKVVQGLLAS